ncbi:GNAT family N-acetyltransferase [Clostridium fermenticellae]|uniref:GNAT family N-acetyltransferase n=1 Tax=Clostridium fermenticellae TaxID=2068654 RepID=A0A386H458_9CLOT|nr:GNAT family N-acetyltransferase [Clostridium fermenticellae]AYD40348.1 GNAT family N-acetyltransferase [Clostridium fermenticellae]
MEKKIFVVRKADIKDSKAIYEITKQVFKIYFKNAQIPRTIDALKETYKDIENDIKTKEVFVALDGNTIIGSVRIKVNPDKTAYLSRFGVKSNYQNSGIGKILMSAVDDDMISLGVTNIYLHTSSRMFSLIRFYYGRGFFIDSTSKDRGYIRALLCKEYKSKSLDNSCTNTVNNSI